MRKVICITDMGLTFVANLIKEKTESGDALIEDIEYPGTYYTRRWGYDCFTVPDYLRIYGKLGDGMIKHLDGTHV